MNAAYRATLSLTLAASALAGCTTTYVGHKLSTDGKLPPDSVSGIPYVMTRPEYSVDIAPDVNDPTKAVYTLNAKDVPDSKQRYTIALDPALLVDGSFDLTFGELGNLTSATSTTTSRVIATLESVVSFAISRAAPGVAKDMGSVLGQYRKLLKRSEASECKKKTSGGKSDVKTDLDRIIQQFVDEASAEQTDADPVKANAKASSLAASRFHYLNLEQKQCLVAIAPDAKTDLSTDVAGVQSKYDAELKSGKEAGKDKLSEEWLKNLEAAVKASDVSAVEKLEQAQIPLAVSKVTGPAKTLINTKLDEKRLGLMGEQFAFMTPEVWRARHLQLLERQLKQKRLERLIAGKGNFAQLDADIGRLEREWAATLGEPKLAQRIAELDAFLAQIRVVPAAPGSGPRYAAAEHVQLREERDKLQERVDRLRNELVAKNKVIDAEPEKKKVDPRTGVRVKLVRPSFIENVAANPGTASDDLPEYVLVIKPIDEPTVLPDAVVPVKVGAKQ